MTGKPSRWRTGRKVGHTIYLQLGPDPSDDDLFIGSAVTADAAAALVAAANATGGQAVIGSAAESGQADPGMWRTVSGEVAAARWEGDDTAVLDRICGSDRWTRADARDMPDHDDEAVVVYSRTLDCWLAVRVGDWIVRDVTGDLRPCPARLFHLTHRPAA